MKIKLRYIRNSDYDQKNLEYLLNLYAEQGYYLKYKFKSFLVLVYDPHRNKAITVLMDYSRYARSEKAYWDKHYEYLIDFGYTKTLSSDAFIFFERPRDSQYITDYDEDLSLNLPKRKIVKRYMIWSIISEIVFILLITMPFRSNRIGLASLVFSYYGLAMLLYLVLYFTGLIISAVFKIRKVMRFSKQYQPVIPKQFKSTKQTFKDTSQLLAKLSMCVIGLALQILIVVDIGNINALLIGISVVLLLGSIVLLSQYFTDEASSIRKILLLCIFAVALVLFFVMSKPNEDNWVNLDKQPSLIQTEGIQTIIDSQQCSIASQRESWVAVNVLLLCDDGIVDIGQAKYNFFMPLVSYAISGHTSLKPQSITPSLVIGNFNGYGIRSHNVIVASSQTIPEALIKALIK